MNNLSYGRVLAMVCALSLLALPWYIIIAGEVPQYTGQAVVTWIVLGLIGLVAYHTKGDGHG